MFYMLVVLAFCVALNAAGLQAGELKRYIHCAQPDGSTLGGPGNKNGILVLDMDQKFSVVQRLTTPAILAVRQGVSGGCGMRGIAVCRQTGRLYYDRRQGNKPGDDSAGCLDLKTGKVVWERKYDFTCERPQLSCDGQTVFIPRHWTDTKTHRLYCLDAATGDRLRISHADQIKQWGRFSQVSHDGKRLPASSGDIITMDTADDRILGRFRPLAEPVRFALTPDGARLVYATGVKRSLAVHDANSGKLLHEIAVAD